MIALQIAVDVLMDLTIVHSRASGDPRASHWDTTVSFHNIQTVLNGIYVIIVSC